MYIQESMFYVYITTNTCTTKVKSMMILTIRNCPQRLINDVRHLLLVGNSSPHPNCKGIYLYNATIMICRFFGHFTQTCPPFINYLKIQDKRNRYLNHFSHAIYGRLEVFENKLCETVRSFNMWRNSKLRQHVNINLRQKDTINTEALLPDITNP